MMTTQKNIIMTSYLSAILANKLNKKPLKEPKVIVKKPLKEPKVIVKKPLKEPKVIVKKPSKKVMIGAFFNSSQPSLSRFINNNYNIQLKTSKINNTVLNNFTSDNINPYVPPDNITYYDLVNMFDNELLANEAIKLKDKAEAIAQEIAEKIKKIEGEKSDLANYNKQTIERIFNETVESKIIESIENLLNPENELIKEILRKKLWNIWYKAAFGYVAEYREKNSEKDIIESEYTVYGGIKSTNKKHNLRRIGGYLHNLQVHQVPITYLDYFIGFKKCVLNYLYRMLTGPYKPLVYEHSKIMKELPKIKNHIINALPPGKDRDRIEEEFDILDFNMNYRYITNSIFVRRKIESEWEQYNREPNFKQDVHFNYSIYGIGRIVYQPFKNLYIYGMEIPEQFDRRKLLSTMFFLLEKMNIANFVDLHDCEGGTYKLNKKTIDICNPYDRRAEREMFELAVKVLERKKELLASSKTNYFNIKDIVDMTAGTILAWKEISEIPKATSDNRTIVHCYAGKGRTGSVLLFLRLRDGENEKDIKSRLGREYFGYSNGILELLKNFKDMFNPELFRSSGSHRTTYNDCEAENVLDKNFWKQVIEEVFNGKTIMHIKLLRQRLNRIFYFLAKKHKIQNFYLFASMPPEKNLFKIIVENLQITNPNWDKNGIKNTAIFNYDCLESNDSNIIYQFSEPFEVDIDWDNLNSYSWRLHQNYVDGIK